MRLPIFCASLLFCSSTLLANSNNSDSATFYLKKAISLSVASKVWEADKVFQKAIIFNPDDQEIRLEYGKYLLEQRKYFVAVQQFGKVLEGDIEHTTALQNMTDVSFLLRRWNDVIMYGNKLLQQSKGSNIKYMLGKSYYELENYGQSKRYLNEAVSENAQDVEVIKLLGKVLIELSDYKTAISVYHQSINLNPNNKQLIYELGMLYYTMNNDKEAVNYFEQAGEKGYKKDLVYYENLGLAYLGFDIDKGVEVLNKVLENKPGNPDIMFQVAQAYFKIEKFGDAAEAYHKIFLNDPSNSRALFMTGVAYQKKGDKNKGIAYCEQAIKMDPGLAQFKTAKVVF